MALLVLNVFTCQLISSTYLRKMYRRKACVRFGRSYTIPGLRASTDSTLCPIILPVSSYTPIRITARFGKTTWNVKYKLLFAVQFDKEMYLFEIAKRPITY